MPNIRAQTPIVTQINLFTVPEGQQQPLIHYLIQAAQLAIEKVEFLARNVAIVHTIGHGRKKSHQTFVLTKLGANWLIKSFQNTKVQPMSIWMTRLMQRRGSWAG